MASQISARIGDLKDSGSATAFRFAWKLTMWPVLAVALTLPAFVRPILFFEDDAMFYPQIAFHIVRSGESTFNGVTPTNGYHPLWMLFNIAGMWLAGDRRRPALYVMTGVVSLLCAAIALLYRLLTTRLQIERSLLGIALLLLFFCTGLYGMEAHLWALLTIVWSISFLRSFERDRAIDWVLFGICSALVIMSRLDSIFLVMVGIPIATYRPGIREWTVRQVIAATPVAIVLGIYLVLNQVSYGHLMPISGAIKGDFPHFRFALGHLGPLGRISVVAAAIPLALSFGELVKEPGARRLIRSLALGVLGQAAYIVLFTKSDTTIAFWYYVMGGLNMAILLDVIVSAAISRYSSSTNFVARTSALGAAAILAFGVVRGWMRAEGVNLNLLHVVAITHTTVDGQLRWQEVVAAWMDQNLPKDARVFVYDQPGYVAYRTRVAILPCDGLVNDYTYNREIVSEGIGNYLARHDIDYYFGPSASAGQTITSICSRAVGTQDCNDIHVTAPLTGESAGSFRVCRRDRLMRVTRLLGRPDDSFGLSLFRIEPRAPSASPSTRHAASEAISASE